MGYKSQIPSVRRNEYVYTLERGGLSRINGSGRVVVAVVMEQKKKKKKLKIAFS